MVRPMLALIAAGLSTGQKTGIAVMGAAFIIFTLLASFLGPRFNANFPGKQLRWYLVVCVAFFVAMMATIILVAREPATEAAAAGTEAAGGAPTEAGPA